jgi:hypothetical protein
VAGTIDVVLPAAPLLVVVGVVAVVAGGGSMPATASTGSLPAANPSTRALYSALAGATRRSASAISALFNPLLLYRNVMRRVIGEAATVGLERTRASHSKAAQKTPTAHKERATRETSEPVSLLCSFFVLCVGATLLCVAAQLRLLRMGRTWKGTAPRLSLALRPMAAHRRRREAPQEHHRQQQRRQQMAHSWWQ